MARKLTNVSDIDKKIAALQEQRAAVLEARAEQIGKIASKAGLVDLEISDAELLKAFQQIAARFQTPPTSLNSQNT
jgi:hypothetical protein